MQLTVTIRPHRLADGTLVVIRRIRPEDAFALGRAVQCLSEASRLKRFLTPKPRLSRRELHYLTEVDFDDHYAVVAVLAHEPMRIIASARWVRDREDGSRAEVAVAIADHLQGKGLGRVLGEVLARAAARRGVAEFTATMMYDNRAAHRLFRRLNAQLAEQGVARPLAA